MVSGANGYMNGSQNIDSTTDINTLRDMRPDPNNSKRYIAKDSLTGVERSFTRGGVSNHDYLGDNEKLFKGFANVLDAQELSRRIREQQAKKVANGG
ncbi:hypothetical protein AGMMS50225_20910 [Betaproteobacteria bacterium]|nr:hypothetical protein AGMMS50225_20910 [Betaproteobacteria bacterium]